MSGPGARRHRRPWASVAVAVLVVTATFPDILFLHASFLNSRVREMFDRDPEIVSLIPEPETRKLWDGYRDLGAASWQLEPAQRFLSHSLSEGESPYWNPFLAAGTFGPERTPVAAFSGFTFATAFLGAGTNAVHAVLLIAFGFAVYCLDRTIRIYLGGTRYASIAGCFAFLLTGFHTSMLGSQMVQPYILAPVLLYGLLRVLDAPTAGRLVLAVLASTLLLAETFLPTTLLTFAAVQALCFAWMASRWWSQPQRLFRRLGLQVLVTALGFLLAAAIWFPMLDSVRLVSWEAYEMRRFETVRPRAALSVVTPKHFWESYAAFSGSPEVGDRRLIGHIDGTRVYHLGLIALFFAVQALASRTTRRNPVVLAAIATLCIGLGRTFGVAPFHVIEHVPVLGLISLQYWGLLVAFPFCLLVAYGFDALSDKTVFQWPTFLLAGFVVTCIAFLYRLLGLPHSSLAKFHLLVLLGLFAAVLVGFVIIRFLPRRRDPLALLLLLLMVGELVFYMNHLRPVRRDPAFFEIASIRFLQDNLTNGQRILNMGPRGVHPNWGAALGIPQIGSLDGMNLRWYARFFRERFSTSSQFLAIGGEGAQAGPEVVARFDLKALDLLGVRYVVVSGGLRDHRAFLRRNGLPRVFSKDGIRIFENSDVLPRAWVVDSILEAPGIPSDWSLSPTRVALSTDKKMLAAAEAIGVPTDASIPSSQGAGSVVITDYHHTRVELEVVLERPGVILLADTWHPAWRATVDSHPVALGRVNEVLRGVPLPSGRHHLVMTYASRTVEYGLAISLLTSLSLVVLLLYSKWKAYYQGPRNTETQSI